MVDWKIRPTMKKMSCYTSNKVFFLPILLLWASTISFSTHAASDEKHSLSDELPAAPYLLPNAPTFDLTLVEFRSKYNVENPTLIINEYRAISVKNEEIAITRAASKINDELYSSVVLEKGTGKIKSLQITYVPPAPVKNEKESGKAEDKKAVKPDDKDKASRALAVNYMAAIMRHFSPTLSFDQCTAKVSSLLNKGKGQLYFAQNDGALRYVVSDSAEKGITFAVEPIKLSLSDNAT
nr:DUF1454 family protein [Hafnia alvei]